MDEEGYLIYTPPADDDGTTALIEDIRRLARETHGLEQVNGVREDMLEIEYLVRQLDLQEEHDNVRLLAQRARELEVEAMLARQEAEFQPHGVSSSPARDTDVDAYTEVSMTDYPETEGYPSEEEGQESMAQLTARINSLANAVDPERLAAREAPKERSSVAGFNLLAAHAVNRRNSLLRSKGMGGITPGDTASETEEADHQPSKASSVAPASPPTEGRQPSSEGNPGPGRGSSGTSRGGAVVSRMSKERRDALSNKMRVAVKMSVGAFQLNKGAAKRMAKASMADSRRQGAQRQQREAVQSDKPKTNVRAHSESLLGQTRFQ